MTLLPVFDSTKANVTISCGSVDDVGDEEDGDFDDEDDEQRCANDIFHFFSVMEVVVLPTLLLIVSLRLAVLQDHRQNAGNMVDQLFFSGNFVTRDNDRSLMMQNSTEIKQIQ